MKSLLPYICCYYQAQICLRSGASRGVEALVRASTPNQGVQGPDAILRAVNTVDEWRLLQNAILQSIELDFTHALFKRVAINISPTQLADANLVASLIAFKRKHYALALEVEITENVPIMDVFGAKTVINLLRSEGILVVLDDFGSGYSSLSYLETLPIDGVKLDRSFINGIGSSTLKRIIVKSVIEIAAAKNAFVIAEGIETPDQAEVAKDLGCHYGQGFLWGTPCPITQVNQCARTESHSLKNAAAGR